ncbi:hypothetical protein AB0J42_09400 [Nonomuraea sp. NPDC049649]|uniref:hypothetical protein n=1 Tax=Nonomuraea sp. NPDC049649 TaxID=3155776 RepID=UPI003443638D
MSKERARRRAEREAARARAARRNEERQARAARRRAALTALAPRPVRVARQGGLLARRRRTRNALAALGFVLTQAAAWLLWASPVVSAGVLVFSILLMPVLMTLAFDRRT